MFVVTEKHRSRKLHDYIHRPSARVVIERTSVARNILLEWNAVPNETQATLNFRGRKVTGEQSKASHRTFLHIPTCRAIVSRVSSLLLILRCLSSFRRRLTFIWCYSGPLFRSFGFHLFYTESGTRSFQTTT